MSNCNKQIFLRAENITKIFPGNKALDNVSLEVNEGEVHALMGENGAGKSTLLKVITGLYKKDEGTIYVDGEKVEINSIADARKNGIYVVPQEVQMVPDLTIAENVFTGKYPRTKLGVVDWKTMRSKTQELIESVGIKDANLTPDTIVGGLSMGHKQIIEIMRALVEDNLRMIAFDEPTASLSEEEINYLFGLIQELKRSGIAIVYVSHRMEEIFRICDKVTVLKDGRYVNTCNVSDVDKDGLISMMVGRQLNIYGDRKPKDTVKDEEILAVEGFSNGEKYKNISFSLKKGEILGVYGLVGSGRTEVMRAIFGIDGKEAGRLFIGGEETTIRNPKDAMKNGMGFVSEDRRDEGVMLDLSVKWNFSMTNFPLFTNKMGLLNLKEESRVFDENVKKFSVKISSPEDEASQLSGGNQQKLIIAKWVATNCKVLILDEPTRGIDVGSKSEIYSVMKELASQGMGIIMVSSELPEILGVSDRILVFRNGNIVTSLENDNIGEEAVLKYAVGREEG